MMIHIEYQNFKITTGDSVIHIRKRFYSDCQQF